MNIAELTKILEIINEASSTGDNAIFRRLAGQIIDSFSESEDCEIRSQLAEKIDRGVAGRAIRCGGAGVGSSWCVGKHHSGNVQCHARQSFRETLLEGRADDSRKSTFLDQTEIYAQHLYDFYTDRVNAFELRLSEKSLLFNPEDNSERSIEDRILSELENIESDARNLISGMVPLLRINWFRFSSKESVVDLLRKVADEIENDDDPVTSGENSEKRNRNETCKFFRFDYFNDWDPDSNGRRYVRFKEKVLKCKAADACCWNHTWEKKGEVTISEVLWEDGDSSPDGKPPALPPDFVPKAWNHQIPFLDPNQSGALVSDWGWRNHNGYNFHGGIDIALPMGTPIFAAATGEVVRVRDFGSFGHNAGVVIRQGDRLINYYHVDPSDDLVVGMTITASDQIGNVAGGGAAHLHYAIHIVPDGDPGKIGDANSIDPLK